MSKPFISKLEAAKASGILQEYVKNSYSAAAIARLLGYSPKGTYTTIIYSFLKENLIDTSHWTVNGRPPCQKITKMCPVCNKEFTRTVSEPTVTCSYSCSNTYFRSGENNPNWGGGERAYRKRALSHYGSKCSKCGIEDTRVLEVHHINHNRDDNNIDNLIVLCANCHLITHKT